MVIQIQGFIYEMQTIEGSMNETMNEYDDLMREKEQLEEDYLEYLSFLEDKKGDLNSMSNNITQTNDEMVRLDEDEANLNDELKDLQREVNSFEV
jgi:chromosome segregation ATPase